MTALIVLGAILLVLIAIGFIRVAVGAKYDEDGFSARAKIAGFTIQLYPRPERPQKEQKAEKPKKAKPKKEEPEEKSKEKQNPLDMLGGLESAINFALDAVTDFFEMVYTDRLVVKFVSAKREDPASAAINYGYACTAAGIISPLLDNNRNVKYYSIVLDVDYEAEKPEIAGELMVSVSIGRVVRFGLSNGARLLVLILKNRRKKGGKDNGKANIEYA